MHAGFTIVKLNTDRPKLCFLYYRDLIPADISMKQTVYTMSLIPRYVTITSSYNCQKWSLSSIFKDPTI